MSEFEYGIQYTVELEDGLEGEMTLLPGPGADLVAGLANAREKLNPNAILVRRPVDDEDAEWQEVDQ